MLDFLESPYNYLLNRRKNSVGMDFRLVFCAFSKHHQTTVHYHDQTKKEVGKQLLDEMTGDQEGLSTPGKLHHQTTVHYQDPKTTLRPMGSAT